MVKVSVVIPTFNRAQYINRAIDSVLAQTYKDYEIIVVDDGSTDNTQDALKQYNGKIEYVYQMNQGISASRNCGIKMSKGEYIAFLDSDDKWVPEKLAIQVEMLDKNESLGLVCSRMPIIDENGNQYGHKPDEPTGKDFLELVKIGGDLPTSTVMTRKKCFDEVGVFDGSLPPMEDFEMWVRISSKYEIYMIPEKILAYYYRHNHQITSDKTLVYEMTVKLNKKFIERHQHAPDFPIKAVCNRIAANAYVLSRIYYKEGRYKEAFWTLCDALRNCPLVGLQFLDKNEELSQKIIKFFKPYGYFIVCFIRFIGKS